MKIQWAPQNEAANSIFLSVAASSCLSSSSSSSSRNKAKRRGRKQFVYARLGRTFCALTIFVLSATFAGHRFAAYHENTVTLVKAPMNEMYRECPPPDYPTLSSSSFRSSSSFNHTMKSNTNTTIDPSRICMTTLTDAAKADLWQRMVRWRNFDDILKMTWPNKQQYCDKHGYRLFDGSLTALDTSRPPSWSKIKAVQQLLQPQHNCEWVFWLDADTVIMNSSKKIEDFLPITKTDDSTAAADFVLTRQRGGSSWNAGAWLVRNTDWSKQFLENWWNMKSYVLNKGQAPSGDNAALKAYLNSMMLESSSSSGNNDNDDSEYRQHVVTPPRCHFNSVAKFYTPKFAATLTPRVLHNNSRLYHRVDYYHKGDFIAHVAGTNNKQATTEMLLKDAN